MISKYAVDRFLARKLSSFIWIKRKNRKKLLAAIHELDPVPEFVGPHEPYNHQLGAFLIGVYIPEFLFLLDLGTGKTRIILDLIAYDKLCGKKTRFLVLVPNTANIENWLIEVETYQPKLVCVAMDGNTAQRNKMLSRRADVFIINYAGFVALFTTLMPIPRGTGRRRVVDVKKTNALFK